MYSCQSDLVFTHIYSLTRTERLGEETDCLRQSSPWYVHFEVRISIQINTFCIKQVVLCVGRLCVIDRLLSLHSV